MVLSLNAEHRAAEAGRRERVFDGSEPVIQPGTHQVEGCA
jgi:hypothetical protein